MQGFGSDDGLLIASEATMLDLDADRVILSACDTAEGLSLGGDRLGGLVQGFLNAGARAITATHWRVDDAAAARITSDTAAATLDGSGRAEALRRAMTRLLPTPRATAPRFRMRLPCSGPRSF